MKTDLRDSRQFALNTIFVRVHQSFQSSLVLAERGLVLDARVVLRSATEAAIALNALANDAGFVEQMIDAHHYNQRKLARVQIEKFAASYTAEEIRNMEAAIAEADARENGKQQAGPPKGGAKLSDINWADAADKHNCVDLYHILYRHLSTDGTHVTIASLDRHLVVDAHGQVKDLKVAPDTEGVLETLRLACNLFLWAAGPFATTNGLPQASASLQEKMQEFAALPHAFPRNRPSQA